MFHRVLIKISIDSYLINSNLLNEVFVRLITRVLCSTDKHFKKYLFVFLIIENFVKIFDINMHTIHVVVIYSIKTKNEIS